MQDKTFIYVDLEDSFEYGELVIVGFSEPWSGSRMRPASIIDLELEITMKHRMQHYNIHPDNQLCAWSHGKNDVIVLHEGEFIWNPSKNVYEKFKDASERV